MIQNATGFEMLFLVTRDRISFESILRRTLVRFGWKLHAYAQVGTHFHLLVTVPVDTLAKGMQYLNSRYVEAFNAEHARGGTLVRRRYRSKHVADEPHYLQALVYIALNPVRAGLCNHPAEWPWGSFGGGGRIAPPPDERLRVRVDEALDNARRVWEAALGDPGGV